MRIALAGNPNSGKTTLFNQLTGASAHVGNYPGVTVEKKEGVYKKGSEKVTVIDLPGIYSLSPYSPEEVVAREVILDEKPDVIINIVDATNLERNLYMSTQLLETDTPVVIALNMIDSAEKRGLIIDCDKMSKEIGVPVVAISALKNRGVKELMEVAISAGKEKSVPVSPTMQRPPTIILWISPQCVRLRPAISFIVMMGKNRLTRRSLDCEREAVEIRHYRRRMHCPWRSVLPDPGVCHIVTGR